MIKVVSISLGSSARNKTSTTTLLEQPVEMQRIGTDGDFARAIQMIRELDGKVDAIGLGGIDLYLFAGKRKYTVRDAARLAQAARVTPVVDGSGLKLTLERRHIDWLAANFTERPLSGAKVLQVSMVDRWGMAEGLAKYAGEIIFGDLMFGLGLPIPLRGLASAERVASLALPVVTKLPFKWLYPTGEKQKEEKPRFSEYLTWADWVCGDFHYIRRNLPPRLDGKVVLTNTTTDDDRTLLAQRGLGWLITTTPVVSGRSFGMNVLEGVIVALIRQRGDIVSPESYEVYLNKLGLKPEIERLN